MPTDEQREKREATILDSVNEGVFTVDPDWRITAFNKAAERITGIPRDKAIGRMCRDVFQANICDESCSLRRTMASGQPVVNAHAYIVNHRGRRVPIRMSTALLRDDQGNMIGAVETFQDLTLIEQLQKVLQDKYTFEDIVGRSPAMRRIFEILPQISESASTVLIEGGTGTGKELFARAIHNLSPRKHRPFVAVNCAALPDTLLESELFGYRAGAFTDARRDKPGRFELASEGTIFLDEVGDISPALQVRLLRVLQERIVEPLGSIHPVPVDVRVIVATNRDLAGLVEEKLFREDLYYRIRVIHLKLPGLHERREDIPLLVDHLIAKFNRLQNKNISGVAGEVMSQLMQHDFKGNVRELENIVEQAFVLCGEGTIRLDHLPQELRSPVRDQRDRDGPLSLTALEKMHIEKTLELRNGNRKLTALDLGINVCTLYRKIKALQIETPSMDGRRRHP